MSVLLLAIVSIPGGLAAVLTAGRPRTSLAVAGATAVLAIVAAASIGAQDAVPIAGSVIAGSDALRTVALTWAAGILLIGLADVLVGGGGMAIGPSLIGLGAGVAALAVADAGLGFALLTAGGLAAAVGPLARLRGAPADVALLGLRITRPIVFAGVLALLVVAWGASPVGPFSAIDPLGGLDPALEVGVGLGLVAVAVAVGIRMGAIPAHVWAARFAEMGPVSALPATLGWGAAAFAFVALAWVDVTIAPASSPLIAERALITLLAAASVLLGGVAAILHDDLEHVLGYSIVQDAGIALLAFGVIRPEVGSAGRDWLIGMVAVKTGFAAWVLVTRAAFGVRRLSELRGWARSSPVLAFTFGLVLLGAVGVPGMAIFEARGLLTGLALPAPFDVIVLLAAFAPLAYLGRILVLGVDRMSEAVRLAHPTRPSLRGLRPGGWTSVPVGATARAIPASVRDTRFAVAVATALLAAVIGLALATTGLGAAGSDTPLGEEPGGPGATEGIGGG